MHSILKINLSFFILFTLGSCTNGNESERTAGGTNDASVLASGEHFLPDCKKMASEGMSTGTGFLQGVFSRADSLPAMAFFECYDCPKTYQVIFVNEDSLSRNGNQESEDQFFNGCKNEFKGFKCFAFQYPMVDPDKQDDVHALNMKFPLRIKSYVRIVSDSWQILNDTVVQSFPSYAHLCREIILANR